MEFYIGSGLKNCGLVNEYARMLEAQGWTHTYNWAKSLKPAETAAELTAYAELEQQGVKDADAVIILLPAGRGTHIELGMALALGKRVFLCSASEEEFSLENTVSFYQLPSVVRLVGTAEDTVGEILRRAGEIPCERNGR